MPPPASSVGYLRLPTFYKPIVAQFPSPVKLYFQPLLAC